MRFLENMNGDAGIRFGFAAMLAFSTLIAAGSIWKMSGVGRDMQSVLAGPLATERLVSDWSRNMAGNLSKTMLVVESSDPTRVSRFAADVSASSKHNTELMNRVAALLDTNEEKALFDRIAEHRKAYQSSRDMVLRLKAEGRDEEAAKVLEEQYLPVATHYQNLIAEFLQMQRKQVNEEAQDALPDGGPGLAAAIASGVLLLLAGWGVKHWLSARVAEKTKNQALAIFPGELDVPESPQIGLRGKWDEFYDILA
jgi:methyl-accepting chemotaxis protein